MSKKRELPPPEMSDDFATVFSDLVSFIAALFILLFTLVYNKEADDTYFIKMSLRFGGKEIEQEKVLSQDDLFVSKIQGYIEEEDLSQYALVLVDEQKIRLILNDPLLFSPGSSRLAGPGKRALDGFASIIDKLKNPIIIAGHTDDLPIHTMDFDSNWELSMQRAYSVLRYLADENGIPPKNMSIQAYGSYQPLVPNNTAANRARNRRVEVNIIRLDKASN